MGGSANSDGLDTRSHLITAHNTGGARARPPNIVEYLRNLLWAARREKIVQGGGARRETALDCALNQPFEVAQIRSKVKDLRFFKMAFVWEPVPVQTDYGNVVAQTIEKHR